MVFTISSDVAAAPGANICCKTMYKPPSPNTAKPATPNPITAPPVKETFNAFERLVLAALAVLTLALVATFIPIYPASALLKAPKTKASAMLQCEFGLPVDMNPSNNATITTKYPRIFHSALRKAMAPSAI